MVTASIFFISAVSAIAAMVLLWKFGRAEPVKSKVISAWGFRDPMIIIKQMQWKLAAPLGLAWMSAAFAAVGVYRVLL